MVERDVETIIADREEERITDWEDYQSYRNEIGVKKYQPIPGLDELASRFKRSKGWKRRLELYNRLPAVLRRPAEDPVCRISFNTHYEGVPPLRYMADWRFNVFKHPDRLSSKDLTRKNRAPCCDKVKHPICYLMSYEATGEEQCPYCRVSLKDAYKAFLSPKTYKKWEQKQLFIQQDDASEDTTAETSGSGRVALNGSHDGSRDRGDSSRPKRRRKHLKVPNKFVKKQGERTWLVERFFETSSKRCQ